MRVASTCRLTAEGEPREARRAAPGGVARDGMLRPALVEEGVAAAAKSALLEDAAADFESPTCCAEIRNGAWVCSGRTPTGPKQQHAQDHTLGHWIIPGKRASFASRVRSVCCALLVHVIAGADGDGSGFVQRIGVEVDDAGAVVAPPAVGARASGIVRLGVQLRRGKNRFSVALRAAQAKRTMLHARRATLVQRGSKKGGCPLKKSRA